jgi:hypothetical protein
VWQAYDDLMKGFSERNKVHSLLWEIFDIFELLILIYIFCTLLLQGRFES